jgi:hypothetical protein
MTTGNAPADSEGWRTLELEQGVHDLGVPSFRDATLQPAFRYGVRIGPDGTRVEFELERGLGLELRLPAGTEPWPDDVTVLVLNDRQYEDAVGEESNPLGARTWGFSLSSSWHVNFDDTGATRVNALAEGRHRFRAFPDTISIEPAEIVVRPDMDPVEVSWSLRAR